MLVSLCKGISSDNMSYITDSLQGDGIGLQIFEGTEVISKYVKQLDGLFADYKRFWADL